MRSFREIRVWRRSGGCLDGRGPGAGAGGVAGERCEVPCRAAEGSLRALLVSPVWGEVDLEALAGWILEDGLPVRFQVQLHKLIWGAERTGV